MAVLAAFMEVILMLRHRIPEAYLWIILWLVLAIFLLATVDV